MDKSSHSWAEIQQSAHSENLFERLGAICVAVEKLADCIRYSDFTNAIAKLNTGGPIAAIREIRRYFSR